MKTFVEFEKIFCTKVQWRKVSGVPEPYPLEKYALNSVNHFKITERFPY